MGKKHLKPITFMVIGVILLSSCGLPTKATDVPSESAADIVLKTAQGAAAATLTQQAMLIPTSTTTPLVVETATPAITNTSIATQANVPMVSVSKDTNCRLGQGVEFGKVGGLFVGTMAELIAIDTSGGYLYIRNPDNPEGFCWIVATFATIVGDISYLPRFTPMPKATTQPSGTPGPAFGIVSSVLKNCDPTYFIEVNVINQGDYAWNSGRVDIFDSNTTTSVPGIPADIFAAKACDGSTSGIQGDLGPGESGFLQSANLANPSGHEITLTVTLCTEDAMAGTCVEKTLVFTP